MTRFVLFIMLLCVALMPVVAQDVTVYSDKHELPSWLDTNIVQMCAVYHADGSSCMWNEKTREWETFGSTSTDVYIPNQITDSQAIKLLVEGYLDGFDYDYMYNVKQGDDGFLYMEHKVKTDGDWKVVSEELYDAEVDRITERRIERRSELRKYLNQ